MLIDSIQISNIYYFMAILAYGIFIIQFVLSCIFGAGDIDLDIDGDGTPDVDGTSIVSFKGVIHFCMGFFGWLSLRWHETNHISTMDSIIAILLGIIFVIILYFVYKLILKLQHTPKVKEGEELVGSTGTILFRGVKSPDKEFFYKVKVASNGEILTITAISEMDYESGQQVTIKSFTNNEYYI